MSETIRIRTTPNGSDKYLKVKIDQEFDFIEVLSMKITQEEAYRNFCSDYGVIVGRVIINSGFGLPNARVSVFLPIDDEDKNDTVIKGLYPYSIVSDKDSDGIRVSRMLALGWGMAAMIGSIAGMMIAPVVFLEPNMMSGVLLYAFAAALVGGIDSPLGAVIGGFIVGILENVLGAYLIGTELKLSVALVLIVSVLTFKPAGLFGKNLVTRV